MDKLIQSKVNQIEYEYRKFRYPRSYKLNIMYSDYSGRKDSNRLTAQIVDFLTWCNCHANRINTMGTVKMAETPHFNGLVSKKAEFVGKSSTQRGTADIDAIINGRSLKIEIKTTDSQSAAQKKYQRDVERTGAIYLIVRTFEAFYEYFVDVLGISHIEQIKRAHTAGFCAYLEYLKKEVHSNIIELVGERSHFTKKNILTVSEAAKLKPREIKWLIEYFNL